ncbi:8-amino-7-oxononanoate synthase 2 [bacterium BMS3Abin08]|nr:8-amino-7-oxononanoate synthase 2 [bacterium BMS3Abin08]
MFEECISSIRESGLLREIRDRNTPQGRLLSIEGKNLINFSSNDYLGLCNHGEIIKAITDSIGSFGSGGGASRLLSGGTALHGELEKELSLLKQTEGALLYSTGYQANTGTIPALSGEDAVILSDELNHASIIDGCRLSRSPVRIFGHKDTNEVESILRKIGKRRILIVTESVFSMDGDIAPLDTLYHLAMQYNALLYIDDAHATGVLGEGRGSLQHFDLPPRGFVVQMGTLSKAVGSLGGFIAASSEIIRWLVNRSRSFIYTTALPPHTVAASLRALRIIRDEPSRLEKLWNNRETLMSGLQGLGMDTGASETPIIPILLDDNSSALRLADFFISKGIFAPAIRYPTVKRPRIRLSLSSSHTDEDIDFLVKTIKEALDCGLLS